jgi:hypothetical protein
MLRLIQFETRGEEYLNERIQQLPPARNQAAMTLADVYSQPATPVGVIRTNTLPIDGTSKLCVYIHIGASL